MLMCFCVGIFWCCCLFLISVFGVLRFLFSYTTVKSSGNHLIPNFLKRGGVSVFLNYRSGHHSLSNKCQQMLLLSNM